MKLAFFGPKPIRKKCLTGNDVKGTEELTSGRSPKATWSCSTLNCSPEAISVKYCVPFCSCPASSGGSLHNAKSCPVLRSLIVCVCTLSKYSSNLQPTTHHWSCLSLHYSLGVWASCDACFCISERSCKSFLQLGYCESINLAKLLMIILKWLLNLEMLSFQAVMGHEIGVFRWAQDPKHATRAYI